MERSTKLPNQKGNGKENILWIGDSTAVGIGASKKEYSMPGRLGKEKPDATIEVIARTGAKIKDALEFLRKSKLNHYNLIVINIGANNIVRFTPLKEIEKDMLFLINEAKKKSKKVIFLHGGNLAASRLLPFPINALYSLRTRKVRKIYKKIAKATKTVYIDLYTSISDFPRFRNDKSLFSRDKFHPSNEGYAVWYEVLKEAIKPTNKNHDTSKLIRKMIRDYKNQ
ncbi:MAG: GDSL-type esterase/lipase family protein [Nanoarchaeota archaeon]